MSRLEKALVNRPTKGTANAAVVRRQLEALGARDIADVLELGCGAGEVSTFLAKQCGYSVVGVDVDPAQVALARSRYGEDGQLRFALADACDLEFEAGRFDLVVAQNTFHHLPGWRRAVGEIGRVLRPGGYVLWLDLTLPVPIKALLGTLRARFGVYTVNDIRAAFRDEGFVEVAVRQSVPWFPIRHELVLRKASASRLPSNPR